MTDRPSSPPRYPWTTAATVSLLIHGLLVGTLLMFSENGQTLEPLSPPKTDIVAIRIIPPSMKPRATAEPRPIPKEDETTDDRDRSLARNDRTARVGVDQKHRTDPKDRKVRKDPKDPRHRKNARRPGFDLEGAAVEAEAEAEAGAGAELEREVDAAAGDGILRDRQLDLSLRVPAPPLEDMSRLLPPQPPRTSTSPDGVGQSGEGRSPRRPRPIGNGRYVVEGSRVDAYIERDGSLSLSEKGQGPDVELFPEPPSEHASKPEVNDLTKPSPLVGLRFDLTDMVLRAMGDDPSSAEKRALMETTRGFRAELRAEACKEDLRQAVLEVRPRLEAIWADARLSPQSRRRKIFQLWDECAERGPESVVSTSAIVRETIYAFIQTRIPPEFAYPEAELAELNALRRSKARFEPYRPGGSKNRDAGTGITDKISGKG